MRPALLVLIVSLISLLGDSVDFLGDPFRRSTEGDKITDSGVNF